MFQTRYIPLRDASGAAIDRSGPGGERIDIDATGGLFIESAPPGMLISFDNGQSKIPARAGRAFDHPFGPSIRIYHAPDSVATDTLVLITYAKDEGIFDAGAIAIGGSGGGSSSGLTVPQPAVLVEWFAAAPGIGVPHFFITNPAGSGKTYTLESWQSVQTSSTGSNNDIIAAGLVADLVTAGVTKAANGVSPAVGYLDATKLGVIAPALDLWFKVNATLIPGAGNIIKGNVYQANVNVPRPELHGFKLPPGYYFCWSPNTNNQNIGFGSRWTES